MHSDGLILEISLAPDASDFEIRRTIEEVFDSLLLSSISEGAARFRLLRCVPKGGQGTSTSLKLFPADILSTKILQMLVVS